MATVDAKLVRELAQFSRPNLRFSDLEQFFPIRAESWLTHATSAPWSHDPDDVAALATDPRLRGTAIMESGPQMGGDLRAARVAGPPNDTDEPLRLVEDAAPDAIGNPAYRTARDLDLFLNFAGWRDPAQPRLGGDLDYLYGAFSELASALDHRLAWHPPAHEPGRPDFAHLQPAAPAVYCEADWAGVHPALGLGDFAEGSNRALAPFLQLTYYYLFPARQALAEPPQEGVRPLEGQWAAISVFYRATEVDRSKDEDGRPARIEIDPDRKPEFVVFSLDPLEGAPTSTVLRFGAPDTQVFAPGDSRQAHVAAYVGAGTHRFFNAPNADAVVHPPPAWPELDYEPGSDWEGLSLVVIAALLGAIAGLIAGIIAAYAFLCIGAPLLIAVGIGLGVLLAIVVAVLIVALIIWLLVSLLSELWDDDADRGQIPDAGDAPVSGGPSAGDPAYGEPAAPGPDQTPPGGQTPGTGPGGGAQGDPTGWWPTNEGSTEGWDVGFFDTMVISRFATHVKDDPTLAEPAWWRFAGRWGIKVPDRIDREWESGTRRTDAQGRTWAYWHAHALVNHLVMTAPGPAGP